MKLKAIIVDDERLARKELRSLLREFDKISIVGEAENLFETVALLRDKKPDIVFLDVQLSNENGFDLLKKVTQDFKLVFVTAFDEFAIRAFEINALDYLLKPVNPERLAIAIERLLQNKEVEKPLSLRQLEIDDRLFLERNQRTCLVKISEISHICALGDYTEVFIRDGKKFLTEKPLREWEDRLPQKHFTRIHRSTIINLAEIDKIEMRFNRTMEIQLKTFAQTFSVSRRFTSKIKEKFG